MSMDIIIHNAQCAPGLVVTLTGTAVHINCLKVEEDFDPAKRDERLAIARAKARVEEAIKAGRDPWGPSTVQSPPEPTPPQATDSPMP